MKAIAFTRHGGPRCCERADLPAPEPKAREVRVAVKAVALNHLDLWVRKGWPGLKLQLPHVLGSDIAGVVERGGRRGRRICAGHRGGGEPGPLVRRLRAVPARRRQLCRSTDHRRARRRRLRRVRLRCRGRTSLPKPEKLSFAEAACLPLTFLTAWTMLVRRAQLQAGRDGAGAGRGLGRRQRRGADGQAAAARR